MADFCQYTRAGDTHSVLGICCLLNILLCRGICFHSNTLPPLTVVGISISWLTGVRGNVCSINVKHRLPWMLQMPIWEDFLNFSLMGDVTGCLVIFCCLSHRVNVGYCSFSFLGMNTLSCNCGKRCCVKVLNYETKVRLNLNFLTESALKKSFPPRWSVTPQAGALVLCSASSGGYVRW